jgi:hypothetical protein
MDSGYDDSHGYDDAGAHASQIQAALFEQCKEKQFKLIVNERTSSIEKVLKNVLLP